MPSPTASSTGVTSLSTRGLNASARALIEGTKWGGGYGHGVTLSFSFPNDVAYFARFYGIGEPRNYYSLTGAERAAVRSGLSTWARYADLRFVESADTASVVGELRFTGTFRFDPNLNGHAYLPFSAPEGGDVWFSEHWNASGGSVPRGSFDYLTVLHEIGHALGLKHSFESPRLAASQDSLQHTVMSYSVKPGADIGVTASIYPTTPMPLDIAAIQALYGPAVSANAGHTVYDFTDAAYWQTIFDTRGTDTIRFSSAENDCLIDLSGRLRCQLGLPIEFSDGTIQPGTVALAPRTVIEHAIAGGGDDILYGNAVANRLKGNGGTDLLVGNGGNDQLYGGADADRLLGGVNNVRQPGVSGHDLLNGGAGPDRLYGGDGHDRLIGEGDGDAILGGSGDDRLYGGVYNSRQPGLSGTDVLDGGAGADLLYGGDGPDSLVGRAGNDRLFGGTGNDILSGGVGVDTMNGGPGRDVYIYAASRLNASDVLAGTRDVIANGAGDVLDFSRGVDGVLRIGRTRLDDLVQDTAVKASFGGGSTVRFAAGALQLDLNGDGAFSAAQDFQIRITRVDSVVYDASADQFVLG